MAFVLSDRIKETTTTTGTTNPYVLGGAVSGFETFTANLSNGDTTYYCCTDGTDFEVGLGTYASTGTKLNRTTIISSSNSNNAVNWSSGSRDIFCTLPGSKVLALNGDNSVTLDSDATNPVIGITGSGPNFIRFFDNTSSTNAVDIIYRTTPNDLLIERSNGNNIAEFGGDDGHAALYFDDSKKLETTSGGVTITGALTGNVTGDVTGNADTATALETARTIGGVSFDGTANINLPGVNASGTQNTSGTAASANSIAVLVNSSTDEDNRVPFVANAATTGGNHGLEMDADNHPGLKYNPSTNTLSTTNFKLLSSGGQANVIGTNTNGQLRFGMDGDFSNTVFLLDDEDGQPIFTFQEENGTAILDGGDTDVTSHKPFIADSTTTLNDDVTFTGASGNIVFDKSEDTLSFADDVKAVFGTGGDLQIYHDGNNSIIQDNNVGSLILKANPLFHLEKSGTSELMLKTSADGAVELYHDNVKKFETTSDGATVTGNATITSTADSGPVLNLISDDPSDLADFGTEGTIVFKAENSASQSVEYTNIKLLTDDITDGTEDGRIRFNVIKAGTITDVFDITSTKIQIRQSLPLAWQNAGGSGVNTHLEVATPSSSRTITLPDATGTVLTTGNSDTPTTTTSSSDADFVLVDDGGTMKKITPSNLGITSGGASKGFAVAMAIAL
tara:strand:+ start:724 stop:2751 length:2028 start_codon:yes stop_codon:yes gene_type:complete